MSSINIGQEILKDENTRIFIPHCDFDGCDLGTFTYTCPKCGKIIDDYEIWWKDDEIYRGQPCVFECEHCKASLMVSYDFENFGYFVEEFGNINTPLKD